MSKTIYVFDPTTFVYLGAAQAEPDQLQPDEVLMPMYATAIAPPVAGEHEVAVFNEAENTWTTKIDLRDAELYSTATGARVVCSEIGMSMDDLKATMLPHPSPEHSWIDGAWAVDPVKVAAKLTAAKAGGMARIAAYAKVQRVKIAGTSDEIEMAAWANKLRIAQAIAAGTASEADIAAFEVEITARGLGETMDQFVARVLANADFYGRAVGLIDGLKRRTQDAVTAADSPEAVEAVLSAMKAQAEAAFVQLMKGVG